ncbi:hypothetical protein ACSBR1_028495 [Camellia fascicularis]
MADQLILLGSWVSPSAAARVRIAFAEKGVVDYESREEDLINKSPLLLKLNHVHKLIPMLIYNEKPLCESLIIVEYIDEVWNHKSPLLPSDPHHQSHARPLMLSTGKAQEAAKNDLIGCFKCGKFSMVVECPKLVAWTHRCMEKESVSKSLPDQHKDYNFCLEFKKMLEAQ